MKILPLGRVPHKQKSPETDNWNSIVQAGCPSHNQTTEALKKGFLISEIKSNKV